MNQAAKLGAILAISLGFSQSCFAQSLTGSSTDLAFTFAVVGGDNWCHDVVAVTLQISDEGIFQRNQFGVEKRLQRLQKITTAACPTMRRLEIRGFVGNRATYSVEYNSMLQWGILRKSVADGKPTCSASLESSICDRLSTAYSLFAKLTDSETYTDLKIISYIDPNSSDLAWSTGVVSGSMNELPVPDTSVVSVPLLADAALAAADRRCRAGGGAVVGARSTDNGRSAAYRGFECAKGAIQTPNNLIVYRYLGRTWLFVISSPNGNVASSQKWAKNLFASL